MKEVKAVYLTASQNNSATSSVFVSLFLNQVQDPLDSGSLYDMMGKSDWVANV